MFLWFEQFLTNPVQFFDGRQRPGLADFQRGTLRSPDHLDRPGRFIPTRGEHIITARTAARANSEVRTIILGNV